MPNWHLQFQKMGLRHLPMVFTENGVAMLSTVLNSKRAVQVNIQIMRTFTKLRKVLWSTDYIIKKINTRRPAIVSRWAESNSLKQYLLTCTKTFGLIWHETWNFISQILNMELKQSFWDFVNEYRIDEAKKILSDPGKTDTTMLQVALSVGFNSNVPFNRNFKKLTDKTPSKYRDSKIERKIERFP